MHRIYMTRRLRSSIIRVERLYHAQPQPQVQIHPERFPLYKSRSTSDDHDGNDLDLDLGYDPYKQPHLLPTDESLQRTLKSKLTSKVTESLPPYTEDVLRNFYKNVIISGNEAPSAKSDEELMRIEGPESSGNGINLYGVGKERKLGRVERRRILTELEERLSEASTSGQGVEGDNLDVRAIEFQGRGDRDRAQRIAKMLISLAPSMDQAETSLRVPIGLVNRKEWEALLQEHIASDDTHGADILLQVMQAHGVGLEEKHVLEIMDGDARAGRVDRVFQGLQEIEASGFPILPKHHDLLIKSYLNSNPSRINEALTHLNKFETQGIPLPQKSYAQVLSHLLLPSPLSKILPNSQTRSTALDLFANMRLAAHPNPSREIWRIMIKSCGDPRDPQPERGRDWWIEMCDSLAAEGGPGREEYEAIMRSLGGSKTTYLEAFDLLREMLAKYHDLSYIPFDDPDPTSTSNSTLAGSRSSPSMPSHAAQRYVPTLGTFKALLEGTKRAGDVNRARWILTEAIKLLKGLTRFSIGSRGEGYKENERIDEEFMSGVFMTYAAWKPIVKRGLVRVKAESRDVSGSDTDEGAMIGSSGTTSNEPRASGRLDDERTETRLGEEKDKGAASFDVDLLSEIGNTDHEFDTLEVKLVRQGMEDDHHDRTTSPQTSSDAVRESTALFQQIINNLESTSSSRSHPNTPFSGIKLTTRLVNSYLSVQLAHSPSLVVARQIWESTWDMVKPFGTKPNGWSYMAVLERCATGNRARTILNSTSEREAAHSWGTQIWEQYEKLSASIHPDHHHRRDAERAKTLPGDDDETIKRRWDLGFGPRQIEKSWISIIRLEALSDNLSKALNLLSEFHALHPPSDIIHTYQPLPSRPFEIRLSSPYEVSESNVPPHIVWKDVDVLHQRFVRDEKFTEVGRVKWVCLGYEKALERRRRWRFEGVGVGRGGGKGRRGEESGFTPVSLPPGGKHERLALNSNIESIRPEW